jgi:aldose 1-epimerase
MIRLAVADAVVEITPGTGGAIASFSFVGKDVLRPTPDDARTSGDVRRHACYPLVPYSNRIAHAQLAFGGRDHALARNFGDSPHSIHGVGWQRAWSVEAATGQSARLALSHDAKGDRAESWPWPFRATQSFALHARRRDALLAIRMAIENTGPAAFPFGLGWHPFFPKPPDTTLAFASRQVWRNDATLIPIALDDVPPAWRFDVPRRLDDLALDHVFELATGTATISWPSRGLAVDIEADRALDRRVVYVPPGRDFLAFEPVSHMTDAFNRAARGEADTGTRLLPPGGAFSCTIRIHVRATG